MEIIADLYALVASHAQINCFAGAYVLIKIARRDNAPRQFAVGRSERIERAGIFQLRARAILERNQIITGNDGLAGFLHRQDGLAAADSTFHYRSLADIGIRLAGGSDGGMLALVSFPAIGIAQLAHDQVVGSFGKA